MIEICIFFDTITELVWRKCIAQILIHVRLQQQYEAQYV